MSPPASEQHLGKYKYKTEMADFKSYCLEHKDIFLDDVNELIRDGPKCMGLSCSKKMLQLFYRS